MKSGGHPPRGRRRDDPGLRGHERADRGRRGRALGQGGWCWAWVGWLGVLGVCFGCVFGC
jgi:hypothetical protein